MTLATQMQTDLATFLESDDFGLVAVYRKTGQPAKDIDVIFDNEFMQSEYGIGVETLTPYALAKENDIPDIAHADKLEISGTTYLVRGIESDGVGLVKIKLEKQ